MRDEPINPAPHSGTQQHSSPDLLPPNRTKRSARSIVSGGLLVFIVLVGLTTYLAFRVTGKLVPPSSTAPADVGITSSGFTPGTVAIKVGQAVVWTNMDTSPHLIVDSDPKPASDVPFFSSGQAINENDKFSYVFDKAGTYSYYDSLNPASSQGTIIVKQ